MTEVIVNGKELKAKDSLKTSNPKVIQLRFKKALYPKRDLEAVFKQPFNTISIDTFDMDYTQLEGILEDKRNELYVVVLRQP